MDIVKTISRTQLRFPCRLSRITRNVLAKKDISFTDQNFIPFRQGYYAAAASLLLLRPFGTCKKRIIIKQVFVYPVFIKAGLFYYGVNVRRNTRAGIRCRFQCVKFILAQIISLKPATDIAMPSSPALLTSACIMTT